MPLGIYWLCILSLTSSPYPENPNLLVLRCRTRCSKHQLGEACRGALDLYVSICSLLQPEGFLGPAIPRSPQPASWVPPTTLSGVPDQHPGPPHLPSLPGVPDHHLGLPSHIPPLSDQQSPESHCLLLWNQGTRFPRDTEEIWQPWALSSSSLLDPSPSGYCLPFSSPGPRCHCSPPNSTLHLTPHFLTARFITEEEAKPGHQLFLSRTFHLCVSAPGNPCRGLRGQDRDRSLGRAHSDLMSSPLGMEPVLAAVKVWCSTQP